jgi:transposase
MSLLKRRHLISLGRKSGDLATALRFLAIARLALGHSTVRVAESLELARSTVVNAANRYLTEGVDGLYDRRRDNGDAKVDSAFRCRVAELLMRTAEDVGWSRPTWTRELLCLQMKREGYVEVSVCTMGRVLAHIGARLGMPKPVVLCPWPADARKRKLAEIRRLEARASASEPVLYSDEVDIHLNPKIGRDWMLRGYQRRVATPGKNEKFYLAGAVDVRSGKIHTTGAERKNAELFCDLLRLVADQYSRAQCIHMIIDNYGIHSAHATKRVLAELGGRVRLHFLPPYCPDANRIERVWQDLHANVTRNHRCKSMNQLLGKCRVYLQNYRLGHRTGIAALAHAA